MSSALLLLLAATLALIGQWGRRNAGTLAPRGMPEQERQHRTAVIRRGGLACQIASFLLAAAGLLNTF